MSIAYIHVAVYCIHTRRCLLHKHMYPSLCHPHTVSTGTDCPVTVLKPFRDWYACECIHNMSQIHQHNMSQIHQHNMSQIHQHNMSQIHQYNMPKYINTPPPIIPQVVLRYHASSVCRHAQRLLQGRVAVQQGQAAKSVVICVQLEAWVQPVLFARGARGAACQRMQ